MPQLNGPPTRCILHGNSKNRRGNLNSYSPRRNETKLHSTLLSQGNSLKKKPVPNIDQIIIAPAPEEPIDETQAELRFTIPNVPANSAIFIEVYHRTHLHLNEVLAEIQENVPKLGIELYDSSHEIEIL